MIGALWTGVAGLASQTTAIDNESNNVANVNTVGYKASRISFADQIYQNQIGKGSYVQDAEKLFTQGSFKVTGASYDIALKGDGFFTVINQNTLGTAETFYTRAGNFRMGTSGTLQTADGYEVQGWAMSSIDQKNDVVSTNSNVSRFTTDFTKNIGSAIIKHGDFIETVAAKTTNYDETAASDSIAVFSGAGAKTKASKLKDIELAKTNYNAWLTKYQDDPDATSSGSTAQVSQINFPSGKNSVIGKQGDSISVVIDGNKYNQEFIVTKTSTTYRDEIFAALTASGEIGTLDYQYDLRDSADLVGPYTGSPAVNAAGLTEAQVEVEIAKYDQIAGTIETYKALADSISNSGSGGLVAYMAVNSLTKKWNLESTYGGKLTENIVQAISRDLMRDAMLRIEDAGFSVLLSVHDELISEQDDSFKTLEEYENLMAENPVWAKGLPVAVEGFKSFRYKK